MTAGSLHLLLRPERQVAVARAELAVAGLVFRVVHHLARHLRTVLCLGVVGVDVGLFQPAADDCLPVGDERGEDVRLRQYEIGPECLAHGDAAALADVILPFVVLEDAQYAAAAEQLIGGAAYVGVAGFRHKAVGRRVILHVLGGHHLLGHRVGGVVHRYVVVRVAVVVCHLLVENNLPLRIFYERNRTKFSLPVVESRCLADKDSSAHGVALGDDPRVRVDVYLLVGQLGNAGAAGRAAQHHVHMVGTLGHEVGAGAYGAQHDHGEGVVARVGVIAGSLPHRGAPVHGDAHRHVQQVLARQVGTASHKLILHMAIFVGDDFYLHGLVGHAYLYGVPADGSLAAIYRRGGAGLVVDVYLGIPGIFLDGLLRVEVGVVLRHVDVVAVLPVLYEDGAPVFVLMPRAADGQHLDGVGGKLVVDVCHLALAEDAGGHVGLAHGDVRLGAVLAYHLRAVHILPGAFALDGQRVELHQVLVGVGGVDDGQVLGKGRLVVVVLAAHHADALHLVLQRRQQCGELAGHGVGHYIYIMCVVVVGGGAVLGAGAACRALDVGGGRFHGDVGGAEGALAAVVHQVVERALALAAQAELDLSLADAVLRLSEAHGGILVAEAAVDAARHVDQRRIDEVDGLGAAEVVLLRLVHGERREAVAVHVTLDEVLADGHGDLELAVGVAIHALLRLHHLAVDHKLHAVNGDVGAEVGHLSLDGERRDVGEVVVVERQVALADESAARLRLELMDAEGRREGIGGALADERYATDGVLAGIAGHGIARQLPVGRHDGRAADVHAHRGVAAVGQGVGVGGIEDEVVQTLVHGPVEGEVVLAPVQHAVGASRLLGVGECFAPYAHLGEVALEGICLGDAVGTAHGEGG